MKHAQKSLPVIPLSPVAEELAPGPHGKSKKKKKIEADAKGSSAVHLQELLWCQRAGLCEASSPKQRSWRLDDKLNLISPRRAPPSFSSSPPTPLSHSRDENGAGSDPSSLRDEQGDVRREDDHLISDTAVSHVVFCSSSSSSSTSGREVRTEGSGDE
ncbi:unnamed protein product [Pleuronectes platessa]|uniref:Uncharacterized protein n=1 Tax=Pleuronectes platessa TaxID=8262 RepID=A0A9N7Z1S8_PLEPL|nr:unnamed protein product [Pleuronectes platessa]